MVKICPSTATSCDSLCQHIHWSQKIIVTSLVTSFKDNAESKSSVFTEGGSYIPASSIPSQLLHQSTTLEAARFTLKLKDVKGLPQTVTDSILTSKLLMIDSTISL